MREYLDVKTGNSEMLVLADTLIKKCLSALMHDERYKRKIQGLQATIITLARCQSFLDTLAPEDEAYRAHVYAIKTILADKRIEKLRNTDIYTAMPVRLLAYYDYLLKSRLNKELEAVLAFIYEVDVYIAVGSVARSRGLGYAVAHPPEDNFLSAVQLFHPCVPNAVGNNIFMNKNSNVLFLTGANMAGKSTLMKSLGIGLYLAHMGFPVAAQSLDFSVREGLYSSINVADNIGLGYSHFYAEVIRVKQAALAAAAGKRLLLMFDELFKGTNVKDAYDGTLAVTEGFSDYRGCLFVISTHIIEVGEALKKNDNILFAYMPTIMDGLQPRYTYQMQNGITEDRQGMMIIRQEGILELLNDARS
jgi:DNA mismatch repair ATPase MutS